MHNAPLVSIIIPTFNRAHLIGETLDSVLAQTYQNWECIVVDDGSTDDTDKVMGEYIAKDARFQYHHRPKDRLPGGNAARNYGLEVSGGKYINWFDSDDLMLPNKLEIQIKLLHESSFEYTICQSLMIDFNKNESMGLRSRKLISNNILQDFIIFRIFWLTQAPLWKRSFIEKFNLKFNENLKQSQDYDFHIRVIAKSENYNFTEVPLVKVRYHADNMSNSMVGDVEKLKSNLFVKQEIFKNYSKKINFETKRIVFTHMFQIHRQALFSRSVKKTFISFSFLISHIGKIGVPFVRQIKIVFKTTLFSISYLLFKKGYSHLKIKL